LLSDAGLEPAPNRYFYRGGGSVERARQAAAETSRKLVLQHVYPPGILPPEAQWISPRLLCYLNNKANLEQLVPPEHVPPRKVVERAAFVEGSPPALPVVLKAASDQSSGGGAAVMICRTSADLTQVPQVFASCQRIVIESLLDIQRSPCLHFAVTRDGHVRYLGFADQDVTDAGKYRGNWMELGSSLPDAVVDPAREVVRRAAALGYRGIAGIDMVLLRDGRIYVLDLNFRVNGSTAAVLLAPALLEERGRQVMHLRGLKGVGSATELAAAARVAVDREQLIPLSLFDAVAAGYPNQPPILRALVLGASQDEVMAIEAELAVAGLM